MARGGGLFLVLIGTGLSTRANISAFRAGDALVNHTVFLTSCPAIATLSLFPFRGPPARRHADSRRVRGAFFTSAITHTGGDILFVSSGSDD
jgi:NAD-dependent SIR2 family protein deacetylase